MIDVINSKTPIARKQHRCDYCGGTIEKGEKYQNDTIVYDGDVYTWKSHLHCMALTSEMWDYKTDEGLSDDDFQRWIDDYVLEYHYNHEKDDICEEWQNKSVAELAKMIYEEKMAENERLRPNMQEVV